MSPGPVNLGPAPIPDSAQPHMVRMRDGVHLATDVYLPDGPGPHPTILVRLPYDKNSRYVFMEPVANRACAAGYAFVVQDVRGKFRSEGQALGPISETDDGYDTIEWTVNQQWSDGHVGMFGDSYYGFTQWAAVSSRHPALKAIVPRVTTAGLAEIVRGDSRGADVPPTRAVDWLTGAKYLAECWVGPHVNERPLDVDQLPLTAAFEAAFQEHHERSHWYDALIPHAIPLPVFRNGHPFDNNPIPVMHVVGWFDNLAIPSMRDYTELMTRPGWSSLQYLYANSVDHENYHLELAPIAPGDDHNQDDAALDRVLDTYIEPALRFFDVFLKRAAPVDSLPRVQWHLGHVGYRTADTWPPADAVPVDLYLDSLTTAAQTSGSLAGSEPSAEQRVSWTHDPERLIPSTVEDSFAYLFDYPDESALAAREDILVFDGAPADQPVDLAGPVALWIRVTSTAPTTDVFARLYDVSPDGTAHLIVRGQAELLLPTDTQPVRIEMGHTGYRLRADHHLRLHIQSSDFPEYVPNPGTEGNRWTVTERRASTQTIVTSPYQPARLALHILR